MTDAINPAHYKDGWSDGAELISITENLSFNRGNAVKYIARAGRKNPATEVEDLEKALWYLNRELKRVKARKPYHDGGMIVPGGGMFPFRPVSPMTIGPAVCDVMVHGLSSLDESITIKVPQDKQGKPITNREQQKAAKYSGR